MHRWVGLVFTSLCLTVCFGCQPSDTALPDKAAPRLHARIAVTNYPLYCITNSICKDAKGPVKDVIYVGPPAGADAHSWVPSTDQIRDLQKVDMIVCNGRGAVFANWMDKVTIDESKLCQTTDGVKLTEFVVVKDFQLVHSHGPEGEHSHSWVVSQSWLSPRIARKQAALIYERLVVVYGKSQQLDNGFAEVQKRFDELEAAVEKIQSDHPSLVVASSTPDVQYLTRSLGWTDHYMQWTEPRDVAQAEKELAEMRARIAKENVNASQKDSLFLWSSKSVEGLETFVDSQWPASITIDLIESPTGAGGDGIDSNGYFERMASNLKRIGESHE